jgi:hypothetical protein
MSGASSALPKTWNLSSLLGWDSMAFVEPSLLGCVAAAAVAVDERSKLRSTEDVASWLVEPSLLGCVAAAAVAVDERSKLRSTEDVESVEFL